ncbi:MAG: CotH kinase family protein [Bacteroidales bacterium]|jgi:hypothetical protein|nr:CotH kinase family protein [Bacteroidales bacterium]
MKKTITLILLFILPGINLFSQENNLNIISSPTKLTYLMGEDLDMTGLVVQNFAGTTLTNSDYVVVGNTFRAGTIPVTIVENETEDTAFFEIFVENTLINTGLPVFYIETLNHEPIVSKEEYLTMNIKIVDLNNPENCLDNTGYKDNIRGRGNGTWEQPKKPYRIKFDKKTELFGLEKAKSWVLLANDLDPTLIMNTVAFELGQRFELPFSHNYVHVELVLNGEFQGSYVLTEQNQVGKGRVNIDENGGFFVELDAYYDEDPKFRTNLYNLPVMIKSPENLTNPSDYDFIAQTINELEEALMAETFPNSGYRNQIDINTFVGFLMINEIVKNNELGHPKSTYMYKDSEKKSKISMGPLWDFDWAFSYDGGVFYYFVSSTGNSEKHPFFNRFYDDNLFNQKYKERWIEKYQVIADMSNFIDSIAETLLASQLLNIKRWEYPYNFENQIDRMINWWQNRVQFLNQEILSQQDYMVYEVSASPNDESFGVVTGTGFHLEDESVTLTAIPNAGYKFNNWNINGIILNNNNIEMTVNQDITAIANFSQAENGIAEISSDMINIFPNPTKDGFVIKGIMNINSRNNTELILSDITGKEFIKTNVVDNSYISVRSLPSGVYFVNIEGIIKKLIIY